MLSDTAEHSRRAHHPDDRWGRYDHQMKMQDAVDSALKADALIYAIGIAIVTKRAWTKLAAEK